MQVDYKFIEGERGLWSYVSSAASLLCDAGYNSLERKGRGFPGGAVGANPPASAGDTGRVPRLGRCHVPWSSSTRAEQLLSLSPRTRALRLERPLQWEELVPCSEGPPLRPTAREPHRQQRRPSTAGKKINEFLWKKEDCVDPCALGT